MGSQGLWNPRISHFFVCLSKNYIRLVYCSKEGGGGGGWLATQSTPSGSAPWLFIPGRSIFQVDKISYAVQFRPTWFWCKTCGPLLVFPTSWRRFSQLTTLEMLFFEGSGKPDGPYKNLSEQINDKLNPHMVSTLGFELRLHWRETNALSPLHHLCPLFPVYPIDKDRYGGERDAREVNVK